MINRRGGKQAWQLQISEAELTAMTRDLDEAHQEAMARMRVAADESGQNLCERIVRTGLDRRRFVIGIGALGAGVVLAGCGGGNGDQGAPSDPSPASTQTPAGGGYTGEVKIVALAVALENQAVAAYQIVIESAAKRVLGEVPTAVQYFLQTVMIQHSQHAEMWNQFLRTAGLPPVDGAPLTTYQTTMDAVTAAKDVGAVAKLALSLEDQAAATYLFAMGGLPDQAGGAIGTAAIIAPVEAMHSAILRFFLGEYPVPNEFQSTVGAVELATFTG